MTSAWLASTVASTIGADAIICGRSLLKARENKKLLSISGTQIQAVEETVELDSREKWKRKLFRLDYKPLNSEDSMF